MQNLTEIVPGEPFRRGLDARGVVIYSDVGPGLPLTGENGTGVMYARKFG